MCFSLFELSILYLLHKASKLIPEPGNLFLAISRVSITLLFNIFGLLISVSSLFKCAISNSALCIIIFLFLIKFKNSSTISPNLFLSDKNWSV